MERSTKDSLRDVINLLDLDIWRSTPSTIDLHLSSSELPQFQSFLPESYNMTLFIPSLQDLVDKSRVVIQNEAELDLSTLSASTFHDSYHSLEEMDVFGDALASKFGPMGIQVEKFSVGESWEGREIRGWKARMTSSNAEPVGEREFVVQSGQHAREWVGPASALYFLHYLLLEASADKDGEVAKLLKAFTFTIVPTVNPDGYVHSRQSSRLWRKTRQLVDASKGCLGIDMNTNWGYKWTGSRVSPCSDNFPGTEAFQSVEAKAMSDYLTNGTVLDDEDDWFKGEPTPAPNPGRRRVRAFVDLHSYGQLFMFPFAYSCDDFPPDAEMLEEAALGVGKAMRTRHGEGYQAGQACDLTYRAPGDAIDFAYGVADVRWSYSAELRDTGTYGFMLPPHLIRPTADEVSAGLLYLAKFIYNAEVAG